MLIEGEATLYEYRDGDIFRYFYTLNHLPIEQLVYKKYFKEETTLKNKFEENKSYTKFASNKDFQKQLWTNLHIENVTMDKILKKEYNRKDLTNYFIEYNTSKKSNFTDYKSREAIGTVNFKLIAGVDKSGLEDYENSQEKIEYVANKYFPKYGAEIEYISSYNRNKWSVFVDLTYQSYKYDLTVTNLTSSYAFFENTHKYSFSESWYSVNAGLRYYMYLNDNSSIFIDVAFGSRLGLGYSYNHKYYVTFRKINYGSFAPYSVVLGYTLFNSNKHKNKQK